MTSPAPIYLDHNATTPVHAEVRDAMLPWLSEKFGNPSSGHAYGRQAAAAVALARAQVAAIIGASAGQILFTGGGTEADNLALRGPSVDVRRVVVSAVEHPAIEEPSKQLEEEGWARAVLPVDARGQVDLDKARPILAKAAGVVSCILAQNEIGVVQPVAEIAGIARAADPSVLVHTDAAQAVGKIAVDVGALGVDMLTVVSHKLYGPCGIGALYVRDGIELKPRCLGGGQERGVRPGTEPVAMIVGLGAACAVAKRDLAEESARQAQLRDALWQRLRSRVDGIVRTGEGAEILPNTLHVRFPGKAGAAVLAGAPEIAASTGSACHEGDAAASGVLGAMGLSGSQALGAVRLSLGRKTQAGDVERCADALVRGFESA